MGLFDKLLRPVASSAQITNYFQALTAYQPVFYSRAGGLYEMDKTRAAVHAFANHCSKLKPHVSGDFGKKFERPLQFSMNPWQKTSQFLYRTATILECENTCFLIPILDERGFTVGAYPVVPNKCEIVQDAVGTMYLRYEFRNGQRAAVEYSRCGVMTKMQYRDDFFGATNDALSPTLDLISMQNQGITNGIKQAAAIRFMARLGSSLRPEDLQAEQKRFREMNLSADNNGGVLMIDQKYSECKQIDARPFIVDAEQMRVINENVYEYFGTNEKILRNEYDENSWQAFYEGKVEVFALQLSLVLTGMFFSQSQILAGNELTFSANRLQFANMSTKLAFCRDMFDRGMINQDEAREVMQMPPLPDGKGQNYYIRGEYIAKQEGETNG